MKHEKAKKFLADYVVGRLKGRAKAAVERHIIECSICERELKALQQVERLLRATGLSRPPNPQLLLARVREKTQYVPSPSSRSQLLKPSLRISWKPALGFALLVLTIALTFAFVRLKTERPDLTIGYEQYHRLVSWSNPLGNWVEAGISNAGVQP